MNIIEMLQHRELFGGLPAFRDLTTWKNWLVFLKALYGLPLADEAELDAFKKFTGRTTYAPPEGGFPEGVAIVGVQSGKSTIAGALLAYGALTGQPGTVAAGVSQDQRGSMRVLLKYAREPFETLDLFRAEVARETADLLELTRGTGLMAGPCRPAAFRGFMCDPFVMDEPAFYIATDGRPTDVEMWRVGRGRVAMTQGKLVAISSPYAQSGLLYDLHKKHFGQDNSTTLIWQASSRDMNPKLTDDYLQRMEQDDPEAFASEVMGQFRAGISSFLDPEMIAACVETGVRERAIHPDTHGRRKGFFDGGGGRVDAAVAAVAESDAQGRAVLCAIRVWNAPFNPGGVIAEASAFYKSWGVLDPSGDAYAAEYTPEQFRIHGVTYTPSTLNRSEIYLELLPLVNSQSVVLLDHPELLRQLHGLERRRGASGKDKVDHRRGAGSHDDIANACAGALVLAHVPAWTNQVFVF